MDKKTYDIAVISGDGIGPEVIAEGRKLLEKAAELDGSFSFRFTEFPWGCDYYLRTGRMMPPDALKTLSSHDAILLGAVGRPEVPTIFPYAGCCSKSATDSTSTPTYAR